MRNQPKRLIDLSASSDHSRLDLSHIANSYLKEIREFDVISRDDELKLCIKAQKGDIEARNKLVEAHQAFVFGVAKRMGGCSNVMDLVNEGNLGLIDAIETFDINSGNRLLSYAVHPITRKMIEYLNSNHTVKNMNEIRIGNKIYRAKNRFLMNNQREATNEELKEYLKEEYDIDIKDPSTLNGSLCISINKTFGDDDDELCFGESRFFNEKTCSINNYEREIEKEGNAEYANNLLKCLTPNEKEVITRYFGIGCEEMEMEQIARRLGICRERVRQIKSRALEKMLEFGTAPKQKKRANKKVGSH